MADFLAEVRRRAPSVQPISDPLTYARHFIDKHGATGEGKVLLAVVKALWKSTGEFRESDLYSLSSDSLALIPALADARAEGRYPEWEWHRASSYPPWRFLLDLQKQYGIT